MSIEQLFIEVYGVAPESLKLSEMIGRQGEKQVRYVLTRLSKKKPGRQTDPHKHLEETNDRMVARYKAVSYDPARITGSMRSNLSKRRYGRR
jgi:hypothetical protein